MISKIKMIAATMMTISCHNSNRQKYSPSQSLRYSISTQTNSIPHVSFNSSVKAIQQYDPSFAVEIGSMLTV